MNTQAWSRLILNAIDRIRSESFIQLVGAERKCNSEKAPSKTTSRFEKATSQSQMGISNLEPDIGFSRARVDVKREIHGTLEFVRRPHSLLERTNRS